jgi:hypothetical protein
MEQERIINIGPVCRFGPGGEYDTLWPNDWVSSPIQSKNAIGRLLDVLSGLIDVLHGPGSKNEPAQTMQVNEIPDQKGLFEDDSEQVNSFKPKSRHIIRTRRPIAKKGTYFTSAEGPMLFDAELKDVKTA